MLFMYLVIVLYNNKLICLYAYKYLHWDTLYVGLILKHSRLGSITTTLFQTLMTLIGIKGVCKGI